MDRATARGRGTEGKKAGVDVQSFWDDIARSFALARRLVEREARKLGIDLDSAGALVEAEREERERRRLAARQGSALHHAATAYWKSAKALLEHLQPELSDTAAALQSQVRLGAGHPEESAADIGDGLEVVQWYLFFIDVKLQRAIASRVDFVRDGGDGLPSDADGSAKIALVAIDRRRCLCAAGTSHQPGRCDPICWCGSAPASRGRARALRPRVQTTGLRLKRSLPGSETRAAGLFGARAAITVPPPANSLSRPRAAGMAGIEEALDLSA